MDARNEPARPGRPGIPAVHERFKRGSRRRLVIAFGVAVLLHVVVFAFSPVWGPAGEYEVMVRPRQLQTIVLMPTIGLPAPPVRIAPPAVPVVGELAAPEPVELPPVVNFEDALRLPPLPPPPATPEAELAEYEHFAPYMVMPELKNRDEVRRELERRYPRVLRSGNVEGAVIVVFWIDEKGEVQQYKIARSSGSKALDAAVEEVVEMMEFSPALHRGEPIKVIVSLPVRFQVY